MMRRTVFMAAAILFVAAAGLAQDAPGPRRSQAVTVGLLGLSFDRPTSRGGQTVTLRIGLNHPAPKRGFPIRLETSDRKLVRLPKRMRIPEGSRILDVSLVLGKPEVSTK